MVRRLRKDFGKKDILNFCGILHVLWSWGIIHIAKMLPVEIFSNGDLSFKDFVKEHVDGSHPFPAKEATCESHSNKVASNCEYYLHPPLKLYQIYITSDT